MGAPIIFCVTVILLVKDSVKKYQCEACHFQSDTERTYRKHALAKHKVTEDNDCLCIKSANVVFEQVKCRLCTSKMLSLYK